MRAACLVVFTLLVVSAQAIDLQFNRDVRPILSDKCFFCHGTDANHRKGNLRLDERKSATTPAESGAIAIVPGKPSESELMSRIRLHADDSDAMPPEESGKSLTEAEKKILEQWIAQGAQYEDHWAFVPARRHQPPASELGAIDAFLEAKQKTLGLKMSPEADRATLIRRATLDITGLPPTQAEIAAFEQDASPNAYEKLIDRLFQSPHYGERMAMQWLDYARYADSHGFQTDSSRSQWPWRDWVIKAFNTNLPFDQFTIQQLAGDLLPQAPREAVVATGFNRNHRLNGEGGIIAEEWRIENIIDRTETMGLTWLALTLNCARCHDHKYDPVSQKDFYSLFAFFNNVPESGTIQGASNRSGGNSPPLLTVPDQHQEAEMVRLDEHVKSAEMAVRNMERELPKLVAEWEPRAKETLSQMKSPWTLLKPFNVTSKAGSTLKPQADGSVLATGTNPPRDVYVFDAPLPEAGASAFLLECLTDSSLPGGGPGRYSNSNFALTDFDVHAEIPGKKREQLKLTRAVADYSQRGWSIDNVLKKGKRGGWAVDGPSKKEPRKAMFVLEKPIPPHKGGKLLLRLRHEALDGHNIGRFRLSATAVPGANLKLDGSSVPAEVTEALAIAAEKRTPAQVKALHNFFRANVDSPIKKADAQLASAKAPRDKFEAALPTVMVMQEQPEPRDAFVLYRGEYDKPRDKVTAALPATLAPNKKERMNRLDLAQWIASPENPLTARVWVNRQWERYFGVGIVKTVENFGMQSEYPTHPELLDWLATEFVRLKWDMKAVQKLMVMSKAYRQSSEVRPEHLAIDPENKYLARAPRVRLSGEVVRDQALAVSGLLVPKVGGPSVRPYMPEGVWDETSKYGDMRGYKPDTGEGLYRRTMYTVWKRTAAPPTMLLFDSPTREICTVKRSRTNTPLQALALLNEVTFVEAARALAEQMMKHGGSTAEDRIAWAFQRVTGRPISEKERAVLVKGLQARLQRYQKQPEEASKLASFGAWKTGTDTVLPELAAYTLTANVLLNLDEVVTRP